MQREELPRVGAVMKRGLVFIFRFFALVVFLLVRCRRKRSRRFTRPRCLIAINQILPQHRMSWRAIGRFLPPPWRAGWPSSRRSCWRSDFIIGALSVTGLAGTLANDLVYLAGGAPLMLLVMGAITSFIFGMGMTVTACYIFLAIVLAPPLIKAGLDPLAVHLFVMYWGMVSFITPPVALATFAAAPLAGSPAMRIGMQSIRLGTAIYVVPFCFVLNPALAVQGRTAIVVDVAIAAAFSASQLAPRRCRAMWSGSAVSPITSRMAGTRRNDRGRALCSRRPADASPAFHVTGQSPAGLALAVVGLLAVCSRFA